MLLLPILHRYQQDSSLNIRLPFEQAHDIKLSSNVVFLFPTDENELVEVSFNIFHILPFEILKSLKL